MDLEGWWAEVAAAAPDYDAVDEVLDRAAAELDEHEWDVLAGRWTSARLRHEKYAAGDGR